jgi:transcription-repair coupling factor (superfamily II helicase)
VAQTFEDPILGLEWPVAQASLESLRSKAPCFLMTDLPASSKAFYLAWVYKRLAPAAPWVVLTPTREEALALRDDLTGWLPEVQVLVCPSWEVFPLDAENPDLELVGERLRAFHFLLEGGPGVVVATMAGALQPAIAPEDFISGLCTLRRGEEIPSDWKEKWTALGYERVTQVTLPGQFAVRGGIVDVASPGSPSGAVRLDLFGETITSIRSLDLTSQRSAGDLEEAWLYPPHEALWTPEIRRTVKSKLQEKASEGFPWAQSASDFFQRMGSFPGWPWQILGLRKKQASLLDYVPEKSSVVLVEPQALKRQAEDIEKRFENLSQQASEEGSDLGSLRDLLQDTSPWWSMASKGQAFSIGQLEQPIGPHDSSVSLKAGARTLPAYSGKFPSFAVDLKGWLKEGQRVVLWCHNRGERERLTQLLREADCPPGGGLSLRLGEVETSFAVSGASLVVVPDHDLFRRYRGRRHRQSRSVAGGKPLSSLSDLHPGDWAVHVDHGLCIYRGLTPLTVDGVTRDFIQLEFAETQKIYLPTEQIALVQRYVGAEGSPVLSKLGGEQWAKTKAKVQKDVAGVARQMVALYSERQAMKKRPFPPDTPWQAEFEDSFLYQITPGQHQAVVDVKKDMESTRPMDRLVCGDVGYGKTEVAIRAAFKAVQGKRQVALLVPTTILAQQHYQTLQERFADWPLNVQVLSRFKKKADQDVIVRDTALGKVDVLIGTHRLLAKDIRFANLGLLIVDEEHRFGVAQKEKLKAIQRDVDVLSLTATPIPRTLHMSLSGIREISVIDTPPRNRLSVSSQVLPWNSKVVAEAIRREIAREGQVFYVHNHVRDIERSADALKECVPEARLAVAHGQLTEHELESVMLDFMEGEADVLVCTSIIESGLDMPNVNTLIVERSDMMGLSQLYQLKGRVGRTDRQAYAYFFYPRHQTLREMAQKRLEVLQEFSTLGSGLHIAMKDMEIRGAGNVLGNQQHGNMEAIGLDLYSSMLTEEVSRLKGEPAPPTQVHPVLNLGISAFFPSSYVDEEEVKADFYRRLGEVESPTDVENLTVELVDRFGPPPPEAKALLSVAVLRPMAVALGLTRLELNAGWSSLTWHPERTPEPSRVSGWMRKYPPTRIRFSPKDPQTVMFRVAKGDEPGEKRLEAVRKLLSELMAS